MKLKKLSDYCGPDDKMLDLKSKGLIVAGAVIILIAFLNAYMSKGSIGGVLWFSTLSIIMICVGIKTLYDAPANLTKRKISEYKKQGILDELVDDFELSKPRYDDALRLGETSIFGYGQGEFAPLNTIKLIHRVHLDKYLDGTLTETQFFIEIIYKSNSDTYKLCDLTEHNFYDQKMWKSFCEELRWRSARIKAIDSIEDRVIKKTTPTPEP